MSPRARHTWMDLLRGAAVLLIVLYHAAAVPQMYGYSSPGPILGAINDALSPYRIPLLLILSGLLLDRSLAKGPARFLRGKLTDIAWPYLLWCLLIAVATGGFDELTSPWFWLGGNMLWYLPVLLFCYTAAQLNVVRAPWWLAPPALLLVLYVADPSTNAYIRFLWYGAFFFTGAALSPALPRLLRAPWPFFVALTAFSVLCTALTGGEEQANKHPLAFLASAAGSLAIIWLSQRIPRRPITRALEWYGRNSIVVYVGHALTMFALVTWLPEHWFHSRLTGELLLGIASLAICTLLIRVRPRTSWLYSLPLPSRSKTPAVHQHRISSGHFGTPLG